MFFQPDRDLQLLLTENWSGACVSSVELFPDACDNDKGASHSPQLNMMCMYYLVDRRMADSVHPYIESNIARKSTSPMWLLYSTIISGLSILMNLRSSFDHRFAYIAASLTTNEVWHHLNKSIIKPSHYCNSWISFNYRIKCTTVFLLQIFLRR